jgi:hypothetical protein
LKRVVPTVLLMKVGPWDDNWKALNSMAFQTKEARKVLSWLVYAYGDAWMVCATTAVKRADERMVGKWAAIESV